MTKVAYFLATVLWACSMITTNDSWAWWFKYGSTPFWSLIADIIFRNVMLNIVWGLIFFGIFILSEAAKHDAMDMGFDYNAYRASKRQLKRKVINSFKSILSRVTK